MHWSIKNNNICGQKALPAGLAIILFMLNDQSATGQPLSAGKAIMPLYAQIDRQQGLLLFLSLTTVLLAVAAGTALYLLYKKNILLHNALLQKETLEMKCLKLEEMNRTKDKFFSIVSHDLKTPLNSLQSLLMLINVEAENLTKEEIAELTRDIEVSLANTIDLANNLIRWARGRMSAAQLPAVSINLPGLTNNVIALYDKNIKRKQIRIETDMPPDICAIADRDELEFVMRNLLCNAIKFSDRTGTILISAAADGPDRVQISVQDAGIGIPEDLLSDMFKLGVRRSRRGTDGEEGTGIGLVLVKELVNKSGGDIRVVSQDGEGACFRFDLPAGCPEGKFTYTQHLRGQLSQPQI